MLSKSPFSSFQNFQELLEEKQAQVQEFLEKNLNFPSKELNLLNQSMRYSVLAPSKRLRPILCLLIYEMLEELNKERLDELGEGIEDKEKRKEEKKEKEKKEESVILSACALELIHTYSLIHDDLPALDNDDFRRGQKTNHMIFGDGIAILSGSALLTLAFEWITRSAVSCSTVVSMLSELSSTVGIQGMIGGQALDLSTQIEPKKNPSTETIPFQSNSENYEKKEQLNWIHSHKTAKFLSVCSSFGAWMAYDSQNLASSLQKEKIDRIDRCRKFGFFIGLAFQIVDDILDREGTEKNLGKRVKKDHSLLKLTYPYLYGIEESKKKAREWIEKGKQELQSFSKEKTYSLIQLADWIIERQN